MLIMTNLDSGSTGRKTFEGNAFSISAATDQPPFKLANARLWAVAEAIGNFYRLSRIGGNLLFDVTAWSPRK